MRECGYKLLTQPPYSPDLVPSFQAEKKQQINLRGRGFEDEDDLTGCCGRFLGHQDVAQFYRSDINDWQTMYKRKKVFRVGRGLC